MKKFKRRGRLLQCRFSEYEVKLLDSLVDQLSELIRVGMPEPAAPGTPPPRPIRSRCGSGI